MPGMPRRAPGATEQYPLTLFCRGRKPLTPQAAVPLFQASWCTINLLLETVNTREVAGEAEATVLYQCVLRAACKRAVRGDAGREQSLFLATPVDSVPEGP